LRQYRYSRWDGTQDVELFTAEDVMEHIADEMLDDGSLRSALRRMMQRGAEFSSGRRMMGLQDLMDRLRDARAQNLERYNLGSVLDDITEKLNQVIDTERRGIRQRIGDDDPADSSRPASGQQGEFGEQGDPSADAGQPSMAGQQGGQQSAPGQQNGQRAAMGQQGSPPGSPNQQGSPAGSQGQRPSGDSGGQSPAPGSTDPMFREILEGMARKHLEQLDQLPPDVGGRIKELRDYDFMDPEARQQFDELMQMLQQQIMQSYFKGLQQSLQAMTPEAMRQIQNMVHDLNELLDKQRRGEATQDDFDDFKKKWGDFFPEGIENVDQLAEHLQQQIKQMESLLNSMTPEMRRELEDMVDSIFNDSQFQWEMAQLAANLDRLHPMRGGANDFSFGGDEPLSLQ
jgi:uncharacterized protein with von Willebrand factor type A (vWA) domain